MTILALDFDGVLHPVVTTTEPKFCRLELLERWLRERPGVDVVISSSWREVHPLDLMQSFFAEDLQSRVLGVTPLAHRLLGPDWSRTDAERAVAIGERQYEIEQWIADSGEPARPWLALDDDETLFRVGCQHLVLCEHTVGLTAAQLDELDAKLSVHLRTKGPLPLHYGWGAMETRLKGTDMASLEEASLLSGVSAAVLKRWAADGRVLGLEAAEPTLKFPRWALDEPLRAAIPTLFAALGTQQPWSLLTWLETPLGALNGRTPRAAIEQGELARVVELASYA